VDRTLERFRGDPALFSQFARIASRPYSYRILAPFHHRWLDIVSAAPEAMVLAPRGHLKSTVINDYGIWRILCDVEDGEQPQVIIVCDNEKARDAFIREIQRVLESRYIQAVFGGFPVRKSGPALYLPKPPIPPWASRRVQPRSDPVVVASTVDGRSAGIHIDKGMLILDDAWVSAAASTPTKQGSRRFRITDSWLPLVGPRTQIVHLGTRYTEEDEYIALSERVAWNKGSQSAYIDAARTRPLWPSVWTAEVLATVEQRIGRRSFNRQFMNIVEPGFGKLFDPAALAAACGPRPADSLRGPTVAGIDVAYGGDDFTACVIAEIIDDTIYLIDMLKVQYDSPADKWKSLSRFCRRCDYIVVETGGTQKENDQLLAEGGRAAGVSLPPIGVYAPVRSKRIKLEPVVTGLENGLIRIVDERIVDELRPVTGRDDAHDDVADAAYLALWAAKGYIVDEGFNLFIDGYSSSAARESLTNPETFFSG
jgi:hypothetical protein